jgi:hypothetical protein
METYHGYYAAKFAREAKPNPCDWIILSKRNRGKVVLQYIGTRKKNKAQ